MALKIFQITILITLKAISTQETSYLEHNQLLHGKGFQQLQKHLIGHITPQNHYKPAQYKIKDDPNLLNIQTLNLYFKPQLTDAIQRTENVLCKAGRCQNQDDRRINDNDETRYEVQQLLDELEKELDKSDHQDPLRCAKVRCGRGLREDDERCGCRPRNDDRSDEDDLSVQEISLRCRGNRCNKRPGHTDYDLRSELERYGKKYKINNDLDAIVLDISQLDGLLGNANSNDLEGNVPQRSNYLKNSNDNTNIDLDYLDYNNRYDKDDSAPVKAIVVNLGQVKDDAKVLEQVENAFLWNVNENDPIRPNELADYYERRKLRILNNALNFVKNSRGDKNILHLSNDQKTQLQTLRAQVQRLGAKSDTNKIKTQIKDIVLGKAVKSEVLPHSEDTNNIYIPTWLHRAVKKSRDDLRSDKKRLFPLTPKQKLKMKKNGTHSVWRRNIQREVQEYGVPFELQIQGLGQVNS